MLEQETLSREEVLKQLGITNTKLSLYEHELEMDPNPSSPGLESFTRGDLESVKLMHRLCESGLSYNEIKLLVSFSSVLKDVDFEDGGEIKNLLKLSPLYRLRQSLNLARQELSFLKGKAQELEDTLKKEITSRAPLKAEIEAKQKTIIKLDKRLSEILFEKTQIEAELSEYKDSKNIHFDVKGKKAKELYQAILHKESELTELKCKNEELLVELEQSKEEALDLQERLELMEDEISENEHEIEERYQEQIANLREQIEGLVNKKQSEWETCYAQSNEQHRKELLTLQRKHEQEILKLKQKIKEQIEELDVLKAYKNPLFALSKMVTKLR